MAAWKGDGFILESSLSRVPLYLSTSHQFNLEMSEFLCSSLLGPQLCPEPGSISAPLFLFLPHPPTHHRSGSSSLPCLLTHSTDTS